MKLFYLFFILNFFNVSFANEFSPMQVKEAQEVIIGAGLTKKITKDQDQPLLQKIAVTLKSLYTIEKKKAAFLFPRQAVTDRLKKATSYEDALTILANIEKLALPTGAVNVATVEQKLESQKVVTQALLTEQGISKDTDSIMDGASISTSQILTNNEKKLIRSKINTIVEKYYKKEFPNLTGQNPIQSLIMLFQSPKSLSDINARIDKFMNEIQKYNDKYVVPGQKLANSTSSSAPILTQINIQDLLIVGRPYNLDNQITDFQTKKDASRLGSKFKGIPQMLSALESLITTNTSGLITAPLTQNKNNVEGIMKLFTVENFLGKDMLTKSSVKTTYYQFFAFPQDIDQLNGLISQGYEFWVVNKVFFAVPQNKSLPIYSLSARKSSFIGSVINDILKAISLREK